MDPGEQIERERQLQLQREQLQRARPGQTIETERPEAVEEEALCFAIETIHLRGVTVFHSAKIDTLLADYKNTCMGQKRIEALLQQLTNIYVDAGYLTTRAYVPQQDLTKKSLTIDVVEGRVEAFVYQQIDADGERSAGPSRKIWSAFPMAAGDIFQLRAAEQGLDQINRLRSSRASITLKPGTKPGTSIVEIVEQKTDTSRGYLSIDNLGSEDTGGTRLRLAVEMDDLLSLNDTLSLTLVGTEESNVVSASISMPLGRWTFSAFGSYSETLTALNETADIFTQTVSGAITADRLIHRDARRKLHGYGSLAYYYSTRFINIAELTPQSRASLRFGLRQEEYFDGAALSADVAMTLGAPFLGTDDDPGNLSDDFPRNSFAKLDARLGLSVRVAEDWQLFSSLTGQFAIVPLFSNQQLTFGGWETVRGYKGNSVSGEQGAYVRNELLGPGLARTLGQGESGGKASAWLPNLAGARLVLQPYAFADAGVVRNLGLNEAAALAGAGVGIKGEMGRISISAGLAIPLAGHRGTDVGDMQGMINLTLKLF